MKKILALLAALLPLAAFAQDEVFVQQTRMGRGILLEELTGVNCGYCPAAHKIEADLLAQYPGQFFAVNIHAGGFATPSGGDPDMRTPDGNNLNSWYNPDGYPSGGLNRHKQGNSYTSNYTGWKNQVAQLVKDTSYVNLAAKAELDWTTRTVSFKVQEYFTSEPKEGCIALYLHVAMIQDGIIAHQSDYGNYNPDQFIEGDRYNHLHVLRDYLTDVNVGEAVTGIAKDALLEQTLEYTLPKSIVNIPLDLTNTHFVLFLTENQKDEVVAVCQAEVKHLNAPKSVVELVKAENEIHYSCLPEAKVNFTIKNKLGDPINSLTYKVTSAAGTTEFTHTFATALAQDKTQTVTTEAFPIAVVNEEEEVTIAVSKVNGEDYSTPCDITTQVLHNLAYLNPNVVMDIVQDRYGSDITWTVKDMEGTTVYEGGPYRDLSGAGTKVNSVTMDLTQSCYVFNINDKTGDGINSSYGKGYISIKDAADENTEYYHNDGKYGKGLTLMFDIGHVANEKAKVLSNAVLVPNPARESSLLKFNLQNNTRLAVKIMDKSGKCVLDLGSRKMNAGENALELPVSKLSDGMYFVNISGNGVQFAAKLVVVK